MDRFEDVCDGDGDGDDDGDDDSDDDDDDGKASQRKVSRTMDFMSSLFEQCQGR